MPKRSGICHQLAKNLSRISFGEELNHLLIVHARLIIMAIVLQVRPVSDRTKSGLRQRGNRRDVDDVQSIIWFATWVMIDAV